jgi:hypothetical protein
MASGDVRPKTAVAGRESASNATPTRENGRNGPQNRALLPGEFGTPDLPG